LLGFRLGSSRLRPGPRGCFSFVSGSSGVVTGDPNVVTGGLDVVVSGNGGVAAWTDDSA
jgi:hypothetical protein